MVEDVSPADWILERVDGRSWRSEFGGLRLNAIMPGVFEAYARILHPAWRKVEGRWTPIPWREVASRHKKEVHPLSTFEDIAGIGPDTQWEGLPHPEPTPQILEALVHVLEKHTSTPDICWLGVWAGYGGMPYDSADHARFDIPNRGYTLFRGHLRDVTNSYFTFKGTGANWVPPNIWWPDDRAWCVASEIDLFSTYVGGSGGCVKEILKSRAFESFEAALDQLIGRGPRSL